jgi:hypothetical protein
MKLFVEVRIDQGRNHQYTVGPEAPRRLSWAGGGGGGRAAKTPK